MAQESENLKVIFYQPASADTSSVIVADGYFSFVPGFKVGDSINITIAKKETSDPVVHEPIRHKTHQVLATDWVVMIDEASREAVATLIISVAPLSGVETGTNFPNLVATHA